MSQGSSLLAGAAPALQPQQTLGGATCDALVTPNAPKKLVDTSPWRRCYLWPSQAASITRGTRAANAHTGTDPRVLSFKLIVIIFLNYHRKKQLPLGVFGDIRARNCLMRKEPLAPRQNSFSKTSFDKIVTGEAGGAREPSAIVHHFDSSH